MRIICRDSTLYHILSPIKQYIRLAKHKAQWRRQNGHNLTNAKNLFPIDKVSVGNRTYGDIYFLFFGGESERLVIGDFCSIAGDVVFLGGGEHPMNQISTFPFGRHVFNMPMKEDTKGPIVVGDDVWIGERATILSGVSIGQGAVIGANSIVTKDVPPYAIWVGNKVVKYRFPSELCGKLAVVKLRSTNIEALKRYCSVPITEDNADTILRELTT